MSVYFQHVGEKGGLRDFPKTIGRPASGLITFKFEDIATYLDNIADHEKQELERATESLAPSGFQIWGIPSGAKSVLRSLGVGDLLLLLEAIGPGGTFAYGGRVVALPSKESFRLSQHLWGEPRFPLIVFLRGYLTNYSWYEFCNAVGYSKKWNPAGNTYRVQEDRIAVGFGDEEQLVRKILGVALPLEPEEVVDDSYFMDEAEAYLAAPEGAEILRAHLKRERSRKLIQRFKKQLREFRCSICNFDFEQVYGDLGRGFIEAHHVIPISEMKSGDQTRIQDLVPVCSNCHRMLHRKYPALDARDLRAAMVTALENKRR